MATKYKGRYVAKIFMDIELTKREGMLPFEKAREQVVNGLTPALQKLIGDDLCGDDGTCEVIQEYADLWEVEE